MLEDGTSYSEIIGPTSISLLFASGFKPSSSCALTPVSVSISRLCCPKAVWVPVRKRRAKAAPVQTSFPEPLQQRLYSRAMSNPSAPKQASNAVASVVHSVSKARLDVVWAVGAGLQHHQPHDKAQETELVVLVMNRLICSSGETAWHLNFILSLQETVASVHIRPLLDLCCISFLCPLWHWSVYFGQSCSLQCVQI